MIRRNCRSIPVDDAQAEYWTIIGYIAGQKACGIGRSPLGTMPSKLVKAWSRIGGRHRPADSHYRWPLLPPAHLRDNAKGQVPLSLQATPLVQDG